MRMFSPLCFINKNIPNLPCQYDLISPNPGIIQTLKKMFYFFLVGNVILIILRPSPLNKTKK